MFCHQKRFLWGMVLLLGVPFASVCRADMQVFGDSLSETGNFYKAVSFQTIPPSPPYDDGRFSNGPLWVEYLARALGEPLPRPSFDGGTNYAFNGARATGSSIYGTPDLAGQVARYLTVNKNIADPHDVFVIWAGANDIFLGSSEPDFLLNAIQGVADAITQLHAAGARNFIVLDLPLLGQTPFFNTNPDFAAPLDLASTAFNSLLATALVELRHLDGIKIADVKISQLFQLLTRYPKLFGLRNVRDSATLTNALGLAIELKPGVDPKRYLFWDSVHPTTHTHQIIAVTAYIDFRAHCWRR